MDLGNSFYFDAKRVYEKSKIKWSVRWQLLHDSVRVLTRTCSRSDEGNDKDPDVST